MLQNIQIHVAEDEQKQAEYEAELAAHVISTRRLNISAFRQNIPSLLPVITDIQSASISVFANKFGQFNIVDFGLGRAFYGLDPQGEIAQQVERFNPITNRVDLCLSDNLHKRSLDDISRPIDSIQCLVILGCAIGTHIRQLIEKYNISHLIIYEPEKQYFNASVSLENWRAIFAIASRKQTRIYLQIEKDGRALVEDIAELKEHVNINEFYYYKHYNHPVFDHIEISLKNHAWTDVIKQGLDVISTPQANEFCPEWIPFNQYETVKATCKSDSKFKKNIAAFSHYFPEIYLQFKDYQPQHWEPVSINQSEVNLRNLKNNEIMRFGENLSDNCRTHVNHFSSHPHKDGLILGYNGKKLLHYLHYQFVKDTEDLLTDTSNEKSTLPDTIKSIIIFGLGVGYQLEILNHAYTLEKVFICEPNPDFFYASLYSIDWEEILVTLDQNEGRLYLNIGDDGSHLVKDLFEQFSMIGPYLLNSTYFFQGYYNGLLNEAISNLREQLRVMVCMGEYFDHAYYGINHTVEGINRKIPILANSAYERLSKTSKNIPVFLVGNGPSIDDSINIIKEHQDKAIIVSCGTVLQVLKRHGIIPDFHAEIEQNRATFDWASLIDDPEYLKKVSLVSCNGIHPDTCDLYKDVYIAFKEGESSTTVTTDILNKDNFTILTRSYPTVANFAADFITQFHFSSIYLFGIDLGFVEQKKHHSMDSAYYTKDGEEYFDYSENQNTSLVVPGNFRNFVYTKHEFKISKQIIEQLILRESGHTVFYNCSDGAHIIGSRSLHLESVLLASDKTQKKAAIDDIKSNAFIVADSEIFNTTFISKFKNDTLQQELNELLSHVDASIENKLSIGKLVELQKKYIFDSYSEGKSLLFYYLYGTLNYVNSLLTKLSDLSPDNTEISESSQIVLKRWSSLIKSVSSLTRLPESQLDCSNFSSFNRESLLNKRHVRGKTFLIVTTSACFVRSVEYLFDRYQWEVTLCIAGSETQTNHLIENNNIDFIIVYEAGWTDTIQTRNLIKFSGASTLFINKRTTSRAEIKALPENHLIMRIFTEHKPIIESSWRYDGGYMAYIAIRAVIQNHSSGLLLPKFITRGSSSTQKLIELTQSEISNFSHLSCYTHFIIASFDPINLFSPINGTRGYSILDGVDKRDCIYNELEEERYDSLMQEIVECFPYEIVDQPVVG